MRIILSGERMASKRPASLREIAVLLDALSFHVDMMANGGAECEDEDARQSRERKAQHIISAIKDALSVTPEPQGQIALNPATEALLREASGANQIIAVENADGVMVLQYLVRQPEPAPTVDLAA